jgi:hypothetical protein
MEEGLKIIGGQISVGGKLGVILFKDKYSQKLIIELKVGKVRGAGLRCSIFRI